MHKFYIFNLILAIRLDVVALFLSLCSFNVAKPEEEEEYTGGDDDRVLSSSKLSSSTECLIFVIIVVACLSSYYQSTNQKEQILTICVVSSNWMIQHCFVYHLVLDCSHVYLTIPILEEKLCKLSIFKPSLLNISGFVRTT